MTTTYDNIPGAKQVGGVWLPKSEEHFVEMMSPGAKRFKEIDGKYTYQIHKLEAALKLIPSNRRGVCLDIGAHAGLWSMWLVNHFSFVHAFEPIPFHASLFRLNVTGSNYKLYEVGLGEESKVVDMIIPPDQTGNTHVYDENATPEAGYLPGTPPRKIIKGIQIVPLDTLGFIDTGILDRIDFIKIDVEGYELPVIKGAEQTLLHNKPFMVIEQKGNDNKFFGGKEKEALTYLQSLGAKVLKVISGDYIMGW